MERYRARDRPNWTEKSWHIQYAMLCIPGHLHLFLHDLHDRQPEMKFNTVQKKWCISGVSATHSSSLMSVRCLCEWFIGSQERWICWHIGFDTVNVALRSPGNHLQLAGDLPLENCCSFHRMSCVFSQSVRSLVMPDSFSQDLVNCPFETHQFLCNL